MRNIWWTMKQRCNSKAPNRYKYYGARGITYDPKWETFEGFKEDMEEGYGDTLQIDRIDNDGNYCKENCRWVTARQNTMNRRKYVRDKTNIQSKYKGVSWDRQNKQWKCSVHNKDFRFSKLFRSEVEAAKEYNRRVKELYGDFALLNVIPKDNESK